MIRHIIVTVLLFACLGAKPESGKLVSIKDGKWNTFVRKETTSVLLVKTDSCIYCHRAMVLMERLARRHRSFAFGWIDGTKEHRFGRRFPAFVLFRDGKEIDRIVGARSESALDRWIEGK